MNIHPDTLWSKQAEAATLAGMLLEPQRIPTVMGEINAESFFDARHRQLFEVIGARFCAGLPCDAPATAEWLKAHGKLDAVGGAEYLRQVLDCVTSGANTTYYVQIVQARQRYRQAVRAYEAMGQALVDQAGDPVQAIQQIQDIAIGLEGGQGGDQQQWVDLEKVATQVAIQIHNEHRLLKTGFRDLDFSIGGIGPGEVVVVGARPGMGKSAFAVTLALAVAKAGRHVLVSSVEMTNEDWAERTIALEGDVNLHRQKTHIADVIEKDLWYGGALRLEKLKGSMAIHQSLNTTEKLAVFARQRKAIRGLDLLIVDYLQLMHGRGENRTQEVGKISRAVKGLAKSLSVPILLLCQLNRGPETRENHRPRLADLRESGDIEQDADFVLLLHREDYYRQQADPTAELDGLMEVHIAKARRGPSGMVKMVFVADRMRVSDLARVEPDRPYRDYMGGDHE
jgi:replicative DNA helicase